VKKDKEAQSTKIEHEKVKATSEDSKGKKLGKSSENITFSLFPMSYLKLE